MIGWFIVAAAVLVAVLLMPRSKAFVQLQRPMRAEPSAEVYAARLEASKHLAAAHQAWQELDRPFVRHRSELNIDVTVLSDVAELRSTTVPPPGRARLAILPPPPRVPHFDEYPETWPKAA